MVYVHPYLNSDFVRFIEHGNKTGALDELIDVISRSDNVKDRNALSTAIYDREKIMSTGIGLGIAIPHVKIHEVRDLTIAVGISREGIDWDSIDGNPVHIIFLMAGSEEQHSLYLQTLSKIVLILKNPERRRKLVEAADVKTVMDLLQNI
ncbi:PTS sugar transporter subunit IIA [bacterium]|nr:PTS sugar transporter subunit IIA [bacterium]